VLNFFLAFFVAISKFVKLFFLTQPKNNSMRILKIENNGILASTKLKIVQTLILWHPFDHK